MAMNEKERLFRIAEDQTGISRSQFDFAYALAEAHLTAPVMGVGKVPDEAVQQVITQHGLKVGISRRAKAAI